jgi:tetratricopeptide (TPR) repeat protein
MTYPGNTSLSPDIRERILSTFGQTLDLASQGNRQEASLGCDFILRLDPDFEPARSLMDRLEGGQGPVSVEDLRPGPPGFSGDAGADRTPAPEASRDREVEELFGDFDDDRELAEKPAPGVFDEDLRSELTHLLEERRFAELLGRAQQERETVTADPELARLAQTAQTRQEGEPYVRSFLESARRQLRSGDPEAARVSVEKARQLDPSFPGLRDLEQLVLGAAAAAASSSSASSAAPRPPSPPPSPPADTADEPFEPFAGGTEDLFSPTLEEELSSDEDTWGTSPDLTLGEDLGALDLDLGGEPQTAGPMEATLESESDGRIRDLLEEGQTAFEGADYQGAIDAWSRIFLIDIDHQEAARRIEEARRLKAEHERQVEEIFHEAVEALEGGDGERAKGLFEQVVDRQPGHLAAREYLQQLEAGETPKVSGTERGGVARPPVSPVPPPRSPLDQPLREEILIPPEPGTGPGVPTAAEPTERKARRVGRAGGLRPSFVAIGGAVLLLLLVSGWLVWQRWDSFFPNAVDEVPQPASGASDPVARATTLHDQGEPERAIRLLERLPAANPHYGEAQALISQWKAETQPAAEEASPDSSQNAEEASEEAALTRRAELLTEARAALAAGESLRAEGLVEQAAEVARLEGDETALRDQIREQLEPLRKYIEMVRGGSLENALPDLWRQLEADPGNHDVRRLLVTAYYNLGVRDLQRGDAVSAAKNFGEAARLDPRDPELERHKLFAETYADRSKDLQYQIYVKYIPFR